jgi:hypothetical protein
MPAEPSPAKLPCLVCGRPTTARRSLTRVRKPLGPADTVPICDSCDDDWTASIRATIAATKNHPPRI